MDVMYFVRRWILIFDSMIIEEEKENEKEKAKGKKGKIIKAMIYSIIR